MSMRQHFLACLVASAAIASTSSSIAQDRTAPPNQAELAKLRELANPGPEHELLANFAGTWNVSVKAGGREVSTGGGRSYMTLENRFLWIGYEARGQSGRHKGTFTIGFDRRHNHFTLIAMDLDGTYFVTSKGKRVPDSDTIKLIGTDDDPYMKKLGFTKEFAHVLHLGDTDKFSIDIVFIDTRTDERKELKAMQLTFTRKAEPIE